MKITRNQIIEILEIEMKKHPHVYAFWLEGSDASGTVDEYSDMDIWVDVQDGYEGTTFEVAELALSQIAQIDFKHEVDHPHPKIRRTFFHLTGTSEFLIIDMCIQSHSRKFWFTNKMKDEKAKVIFDKRNVIEFRDLDITKFQKDLKEKVEELKKTFLFFQAWVKKGINRNNYLESLSYYHQFVLNPLVELLRIKYQPTKFNFGLKHVNRDLPPEIVKQLEDLHKVNSTTEISAKSHHANTLFFKTLHSLPGSIVS